MIELPISDALTSDQVSDVTVNSLTRLIVIAGEDESGKTTLITEVYRRFKEGPFGGFDFSGSRTLHGFEQRSHESQIRSGLLEPSTERTLRGNADRFMHLRVRAHEQTGPVRDLLMTDWPGEAFQSAKDSFEEMNRIMVFHTCNRLTVLVDGDLLCRLDRRQSARADVDMFLQRALDAGKIGPASWIDVVFTKWDLIARDDSSHDSKSFSRLIEKGLGEKYRERFGELRFWRVAARPVRDGDGIDFFELEELFHSWVNDKLVSSGRERRGTEGSLVGTREFDRFLPMFDPSESIF